MAKFSYKKSMEELDSIVEQMESEDPDIDQLSRLVHRASELIANCRTKLRDTQEEIDQSLAGMDNSEKED